MLAGVTVDLTRWRGAVEKAIAEAAGVGLRIERLAMTTGPVLELRASGLALDAADGAIGRVGELRVTARLWPLLRRTLHLEAITGRGIELDPQALAGALPAPAGGTGASVWTLRAPTRILAEDLRLRRGTELLEFEELSVERAGADLQGTLIGEVAGVGIRLSAEGAWPALVGAAGSATARAELGLLGSRLRLEAAEISPRGELRFRAGLEADNALYAVLPGLLAGPSEARITGHLKSWAPLQIVDWTLAAGAGLSAEGTALSLAAGDLPALDLTTTRYQVALDQVLGWFDVGAGGGGLPAAWPVLLAAQGGAGLLTYRDLEVAVERFALAMDRRIVKGEVDARVVDFEGASGPLHAAVSLSLGAACQRITLAARGRDWHPAQRFEGLAVDRIGAWQLRTAACMEALRSLKTVPELAFSASQAELRVFDRQGRPRDVRLDEFDLEAGAEGSRLRLAGLLGQTPVALALHLPGKPRLDAERIAIETELVLGALEGSFRGALSRVPAGLSLAGATQASSPRYGGLAFRSDVVLAPGEIALENTRVDSPAGELQARFLGIRGESGERSARLELRSPRIDAARLTALGEAVEAKPPAVRAADFDWLDLDFSLLRQWLSFPALALDVRVGAISGTEFPIQDLVLKGRVGEQRIDGGELAFGVFGAEVHGTVTASLEDQRAVLALDADVRGFDADRWLAPSAIGRRSSAHFDELLLDLDASGSDLRGFLRSVEVTLSASRADLAFRPRPGAESFALPLRDARLVAGPEIATRFDSEIDLFGVAYEATAVLPGVRDLVDGLPMLEGRLELRNETTAATGVLALPLPVGRDAAELEISARGADLWRLGLFEGGDRVADAPDAVPFEIDAGVSLAPAGLRGRVEHLVVGASRLGPVSFSLVPGEPTALDVDLSAKTVFLEDLLPPADPTPDGASGGEGAANRPVSRFVEALVASPVATLSETARIKLRAAADNLRWNDVPFGEVRLDARAGPDGFRIDELSARTENGDIALAARMDRIPAGFQVRLDLDVDALDLDALRAEGTEATPTAGAGLLFLRARGETAADPAGQLDPAFDGVLEFFVWPRDLDARKLDLWVSNLTLAILPVIGQPQSDVNCIVGRFPIEKGRMEIDTLLLDTDRMIVRGTGWLDLQAGTLEVNLGPQSKRSAFFAVETPVSLRGTLDDPRIGVGLQDFAVSLLRLYYNVIWVPLQWLFGNRPPRDGTGICLRALNWEDPADRPAALRHLQVE